MDSSAIVSRPLLYPSQDYCDTELIDDDSCATASSAELSLQLPSEIESAIYSLMISVEYNDGDEIIESEYTLDFLATEEEETTTDEEEEEETTEEVEESIIDIDPTIQEIEAGAGVVYKITIANLGTETKEYTLDVKGLEDWEVDLEAGSLTIKADETEEAYLFVTIPESANAGTRTFTVTVKSDEQTEEISLKAVVKELPTATAWEDVKTGLEIGFIVLLAILIIIGLIFVFKRKKEDIDFEEPENEKDYY